MALVFELPSNVKASSQTSTQYTFWTVHPSPTQWTCSIDLAPKITFFKVAPFFKIKHGSFEPPSTFLQSPRFLIPLSYVTHLLLFSANPSKVFPYPTVIGLLRVIVFVDVGQITDKITPNKHDKMNTIFILIYNCNIYFL